MQIKKVFDINYWKFKKKEYKVIIEMDRNFNASFRGVSKLSTIDEKSKEFKYIKLYRLTQVHTGTIWYHFFYWKLKKISERTGIGLYANLNIGKGLIIGHCGTIVLNEGAIFGNEIMLTHGVTIGRDVRGFRKGAPIIGNRVCIKTNSTIVGKINIGDDVLIAPNTFVNFDVPSHSVVVGNPATIHSRMNSTEGHLGTIIGGIANEQ